MRSAIDPAFLGRARVLRPRRRTRSAWPFAPWAAEATPTERAELPPRTNLDDAPELAPLDEPKTGKGFELATYRSLFSGREVERTEALAFQRPPAEVEISKADADEAARSPPARPVVVGTNGTSRELRARR